MLLSYHRIPPVARGQRITSTQLAAMATGVNDRILNGPDVAWRLNKYLENWARQFRNPSAGGFNFPPQAEWFYFYSLIDSDKGIQAPDAGPGEPEGASYANQMNQFVFGNPALDSEDNRLSNNFPLWINTGAPATLADVWDLGKAQRGAITATGEQSTPAINAALSWVSIGSPYYSQHGKGWGGYFPSPAILLDGCDNPGGPYELWPSVQLVFTNTVSGAVVTYPGTCPSGSDFGGAGQVIYTSRLPQAIYVFVDDGAGGYTLDTYPRSIWIEGPYADEPRLRHSDGDHIQRALWSFIKDFRGTNAQRTPDTYDIQKIGFDFQAFLTKQYPLAPNFGTVSGGGIEAQYPIARIAANASADSFLPFVDSGSGTSFAYQSGFVLSGMYAAARNLSSPCTLNVLDQTSRVLGSLTLAAGSFSEAMLWLDAAETPTSIRVQLASAATFTGAGALAVETTQLYPMKPQYYDAYLVLRESATRGGFDAAGVMDGSGFDETHSREIYETFSANGCVLNRHGASGPTQIEASITSNPVYDAMRRMCREYMRIIQTQNFTSYEVAGGKSIIKFKRYAFGASADLKADVFCNIAPPYSAVTELIAGETYIVRGSGVVSTSGGVLNEGETFTAVAEDLAFELYDDALLYVYNGIRTVALPNGMTNEWVIYFEFHPYHWSESSQWKPDAYANYFTGINRCMFQSGSIATGTLRNHVNYTAGTNVTASVSDPDTFTTTPTIETVQQSFVNPEAPSSYNFADNSNTTAEEANPASFYKSCQVFQSPYVIESAIVETSLGIETVKITLATRLRSHESAPATVDPNPSNWSAGEIFDLRSTEDYRTDDNAIREYMLLQYLGTNATFKTGDSGTLSDIRLAPDNPYGCVYPKAFCVKLVSKPYEDGNDTMQLTDTRCTMDVFNHVDTLLRAGCEGFIDGGKTEELCRVGACGSSSGGLYDFTYDDLIFKATGRAQISPLADTNRLDAAGFSALPNTVMMAQQYNDLAACWNELTRFRLMIPVELEYRADEYYTAYEVSPSISNPLVCADGANTFAAWTGSPASPALSSTGVWSPVDPGPASCSAAFAAGTPFCGTGGYLFASSKQTVSYRVKATGDYLNAIPQVFQDLMVSGGSGFLACYSDQTFTNKMEPATIADATNCDVTPAVDASGSYYKFSTIETRDAYLECRLLSSGTLDTGTAPASAYGLIHDVSGSTAGACNYGSSRVIGFSPFGATSGFIHVPLV